MKDKNENLDVVSQGDHQDYKNLIFQQLNKCCHEGSKEMNRGGLKKKIVDGQSIEIDTENQREVFFNSVLGLYILLLPMMKLIDKKYLEELQELDREIQEEESKALKFYNQYKQDFKDDKFRFSEAIDDLNDNLELKKVKISQKKLILLNFVLSELNFFDSKSNNEEFNRGELL